MTDPLIVRCPSCGTDNRVPASRLGGRERPVCGRCRTPLVVPQGTTREVGDGDIEELIATSPLPVLVDCWAPWCGPCRALRPVLEKIASSSAGKLLVLTLNVDENPLTARRYRIGGIPTLLLFTGGRLVDRSVGAQPEPLLRRWLSSHGVG